MKRLSTLLTLLVAALLGLLPMAQAQTCVAPTNVRVSSVGSPGNNTAVVSFTPSATAVSYTVRYFWIGDSTVVGIMSVNTSTSPVTLTGLRTGSGAYYRVSVVSNCTGGFTTSSPWVGFQVGGSGGPGPSTCSAPTNVTVTNIAGSILLSVGFTPVAGAASYTVSYYPAYDSAGVQTITAMGSPIVVGNGILPGTNYVIRIVTNCANGATSSPVTVTGHTGGVASCNAPSGFYVATSTTTTASVAFILDSNFLSYTLSYYPAGANPATAQTLTVTTAPVQLTGLTPNTVYTVTIRANCANGGTSPTRSTTFSTRAIPVPCGAVTTITVTATSASTAIVNFTPGVGNTSFHIAYYSSAIDSTWISASGSGVTITGLVPGRTYTIRVISICGTSGSSGYNAGGAPVVFTFRGALASRAALGAGTLSVFPNPAHRTASLVVPAVPGILQAHLILLNAVGQQVRTLILPLASAAETRTQLDLSGLASGLYTLRVVAGQQSASQRLVVE